MSAESNRVYTVDYSLALERESEVRYEYQNGEVFDISGGALNHDLVMHNVRDALNHSLGDMGSGRIQ